MMCQTCDDLQLVLVEETLTLQLMAAQRDAGFLPASAIRPLFEHEVSAQVMFGQLEDDLDAAVNKVTALVEESHRGLLALLIEAIFGKRQSLSPKEVADGIARLQAEAPAEVLELLDTTAASMETILAGTYGESAARVVEEYRRQGGKAEIPLPELGGRAGPLSAPVAARTWSWITQKATEHIAQPSVSLGEPISKAGLAKTLGEQIKPAGAVDQARQSVHTATGVARIETGELYEPQDIYASELLDGNTCRPCASVDGTQYEDMEEAMNDYPLGYYSGCRGNARCRGTLLFLFKIDD